MGYFPSVYDAVDVFLMFALVCPAVFVMGATWASERIYQQQRRERMERKC